MRSQSKKCRLGSGSAAVQPTPVLSQASDIAAGGDLSPNDAPPIDDLSSASANTQTSTRTKTAAPFVRHEKYWLLDGNVLVQIGQVRFRLHRSTLVKQSKWFRDMIEDPPHDRCIYVDEGTGATVYVLDSLEVDIKDFIALLDALENAMYVPFHSLINFD